MAPSFRIRPSTKPGAIHQLTVRDSELADAIHALPFPQLTTNYDQLLESRGRRSVSWLDALEMQRALASGEVVGHLHGVWNSPDSVILTGASYGDLRRSETAQAIQSAASTLKSLVYVGYGAGLADPNFSNLVAWHASKFLPSAFPHFRLCRSEDYEALVIEHANDHIVPVVYGDRFEDLAEFLRQCLAELGEVALTSTGVARDIVADARISLVDELKRDAIIAETLDDQDGLRVADLILPPVLLPVPHADYVKSRTAKDPSQRISRLDPLGELTGADVIVLASEENNGLTTALKWLALEAANYLGAAVPLYVPFQRCRPGPKPLEEQVRTEAVLREAIARKRDPLPAHVLVLDDFSPFVPKVSDKVFKELAEGNAILTIVGCRQGVEDEVAERLSALGRKPVVRYLGRLAASDIRQLARLAWPGDSEQLAERVLQLLEAENLPRTPYTVGLLISVLVRGSSVSKNASHTSILDDYIGLLLGRGDPHDDARFGLDQTGREAVLADLAEAFVDQETGGLTEPEIVWVFQATFDKYGWPDSPTELLGYFLDRHVLRRDGGHIAFARSSYLHIFAAKRAIADGTFRTKLLKRPLFYSSALTDYAALYRHDAEMVTGLSALLTDRVWTAGPSPIFETIATNGDIPELSPEADQRQRPQAPEVGADHFFDSELDLDRPPFPVVDEVNVPNTVHLMRVLDLVSTVLRDSDQVSDLSMKERVLEGTLHAWGEFMTAVYEDRSFHEFLKTILDEAGVEGDGQEETAKIIPAAMALAGIGHTLASRKLVVVLKRILDRNPDDELVVISAAFFIYALSEDDWIEQLGAILRSHQSKWVVRNFILHLLVGTYIDDQVPESKREGLLNLCIDIWFSSSAHSQASDWGAMRSYFNQLRLRQRMRKQALGPSATAEDK